MDNDATLEYANELAARLSSDLRVGEISLIDKASALAELAQPTGWCGDHFRIAVRSKALRGPRSQLLLYAEQLRCSGYLLRR
jgi:stress-induced morphogen